MTSKTTATGRSATGSRRQRRAPGPAPGSRLADAFEAVERFPVLIESRERVMQAATAETSRVGELVETVESDVALTIAVLRFANRSGAPPAASPAFRKRSTCSSPPACWRSPAPRRSTTSSSPTAAGS